MALLVNSIIIGGEDVILDTCKYCKVPAKIRVIMPDSVEYEYLCFCPNCGAETFKYPQVNNAINEWNNTHGLRFQENV